jgi:hypothetical protein
VGVLPEADKTSNFKHQTSKKLQISKRAVGDKVRETRWEWLAEVGKKFLVDCLSPWGKEDTARRQSEEFIGILGV